jgi:hypothetical protein
MRVYLFILVMGCSAAAKASIFLEPYAGYSLSGTYSEDRGPGTGSFSTVTNGTDAGKLEDAFTYGGRLGYQAETVFIGGDYQASRSKFTANNNKDQLQLDGLNSDFTSIGVLLGFRFGAFRIWGVDFLSDKMAYSTSSGTKDEYTGTGFKVGAGLLLYSHINFNVEYVSHSYNKFSSGSASSVSLPGTYDDNSGDTLTLGKFSASSVLLSISFPFGF